MSIIEFIEKAKNVHCDDYDYSLVDYKNNKTKIRIICKKCNNIFEQRPDCHIVQKQGCPNCWGTHTKGKEKFILDAILVHGNKYDYSMITDYKNNKTKVPIFCHEKDENGNEHGLFWQTPLNHIINKNGCCKCGSLSKGNILKKLYTTPQDIFIAKCEELHNNKYDYSLVEYKGARSNIKIICPKHGIFEQLAGNHIRGYGCLKCFGGNKTTEEFIKEAQQIHDKYDYSKVNYIDYKTKVCIICSKHGEFFQIPNSHLNGHGCSKCRSSGGEKLIRNFLIENFIKFIFQERFKECKDILVLSFDFYLPDYNLCIEYDGEHHFKIVRFGGMSLEKAQKNFENTKKKDVIKTKYCLDNSIKLIRIPYWEKDKIEEILQKELING